MVIYFGEEVEYALKQYFGYNAEAATLFRDMKRTVFIHAAPPYGSPGS